MASTLRKTIKNRSNEASADVADDSPAEYATKENSLISPMSYSGTTNTGGPMSISDLQSHNEVKQSRVNEMLNRITNVSAQNDGSNLVDFAPYGKMQKPGVEDSGLFAGNQQHELLPKVVDGFASGPGSGNPRGALNEEIGGQGSRGLFVPNETSLGKYTNYRAAHDPANILKTSYPGSGSAPYYAKMGIGKGSNAGITDERLMEKINYMIRLLEEQQLEKTNNVAEEFILYTLLGVFVIYVVDSFSRAGKYMR